MCLFSDTAVTHMLLPVMDVKMFLNMKRVYHTFLLITKFGELCYLCMQIGSWNAQSH